MAAPTNVLQQVQVYNRSNIAFMQNLCCFVHLANKKFKNFQNETANLGSSTTFDLPPRMTSAAGLVATFQPATQRVLTLTCDQASNISYEFTAQERIFNVDKDVDSYMDRFGKAAMYELANEIEANLALNIISAVPVNTIVNGQTVPTGALHTESGPYRFYGDGVTAIDSYQKLAQAVANFKNYSAVNADFKFIFSDLMQPAIIGSGLGQFAPRRNDEIANSWEVGGFGTPQVDYYVSNLLPIHTSGNVGINATTLTVVSVNDPTGANVTAITFSGATASDLDAIKSGDLGQFQDGVSGKKNLRYLTFVGHNVSGQPVQVRALADAAADVSGNVTVSIFPALQWTAGATQNLNTPIVAGMTMKFLPTHRAGLLYSGGAFFVSMPKLPDQYPFATSVEQDDMTGVSLRMSYGSIFAQNQMGIVHDCTWGSVLVPENSMRIIIPV